MIAVSVIIPHFNSPEKLKRLLDSIPAIKDIEVIVIDDRSDVMIDEYKKIKDFYQSNRVIFYDNNKIIKGAGVCRNIGIENSIGKWLLFADSDDFFLPNFYQSVKMYFDSYFDLVFFSPASLDLISNVESDRHTPYRKLIEQVDSPNGELYLRTMFGVPWSKLIKRSLIESRTIRFDEVIASNDVMFSTKIGYFAENIKTDKKEIYCVTKDKNTLTQRKTKEIFQTRLKVAVEFNRFIRSKFDKNTCKLIELRGKTYLYNVIKYKYGMKEFIVTLKVLIKNKFRLL